MARPKRATWFKMFYHNRAVLDALSDTDVGKAIKAAFAYFDGEQIDPAAVPQGAFIAFSVIRPQIDEALQDYSDRVERGRQSQDSSAKHS